MLRWLAVVSLIHISSVRASEPASLASSMLENQRSSMSSLKMARLKQLNFLSQVYTSGPSIHRVCRYCWVNEWCQSRRRIGNITSYPMFVRWRSILQAVRCFEDNDIVHVNGKIDPKTGIDLINLELYFSDLDQRFGDQPASFFCLLERNLAYQGQCNKKSALIEEFLFVHKNLKSLAKKRTGIVLYD
ncbi:hypothetical protein SDJN03_01313, partial [Cucurbita argyrosperma subsp. sororia]